jgi:hypothetical protein
MPITEKDIKKLWGLAAGRCSRPGCEQECIQFLNASDPTVIGEMAHVIAKKPGGPRGHAEGGADSYENLILLCPTHHTEIDKAPEGSFTADRIRQWKATHEERVKKSFLSPRQPDKRTLGEKMARLLINNKATWTHYGPESEEAKRNPLSNSAQVWELRKLDTVVPNNRKIVGLIQQNQDLIDLADYPTCAAFVEHVEGFERNCYTRTEGVPRFPPAFEQLVNRYAGLQ